MNSNTRTLFLIGLFTVQFLCTLFFGYDAVLEFFGIAEADNPLNESLETAVTICLILGTLFTGWELRSMLLRQSKMRQQLKIASGAFASVLETQFDTWALSEAERSVAILGIKGFSIAEIAELRNTKEGTIKAQNTSVYRKAGVSGKQQLLSLFLEDLIDSDLVDSAKIN